MVGRHKTRPSHKPPALGNHQKCWIWGRNLVTETLRAGRWPILELHLARSLPENESSQVRQAASAMHISIEDRSTDQLLKLCRNRDHQGFVAKMAEYPYVSLLDLLDNRQATEQPLFVVCDCIQDPFNFGAMVRTAEALGVTGVIIGQRDQVGVTSHVARASAGAVNHLAITRTDDLLATAGILQSRGTQLVAASEKAEYPLSACDLKPSTAVVIGNEGRGVCAELWKLCDTRARIPLTGNVASLNAAVASGIVLYEAHRQRRYAPIGPAGS